MDILLVQPAISKEFNFVESSHNHFSPLGLALLAGLTPEEHSISLTDDRLEEITYDPSLDLVGISTTTFTARRAYEIADRFKARGVPVVIGGHHPTLLPEEASLHADAVLIGEAEGKWKRLLSDREKGELKPVYSSERKPPFSSSPPPNRDIFRGKGYLPVGLVETTRGCPYRCEFCSVHSFFGSGYRHKSIGRVLEEIERMGKDVIFFVDDNIAGDVKYAKELFKRLIPLQIRWFGQASLRIARDQELLRLMKESGCIGNLIGIESLSEESLKQVNKTWNKELPYSEAIERIHGDGLGIFASFILGLDGDDAGAVERTLRFALKSKFMAANFNMLVPYPGTATYRKLKEEGRLLRDPWWLKESYEERYGLARFSPLQFEPDELARKVARANRDFYSYGSIFSRGLNVKANLRSPFGGWLYFALNRSLRGQYRRQYESCLSA